MPNYLDLVVSLDGVKPPIWRRFLLRERATFLDVHQAIQTACGWDDDHLFAFRDGDGTVIAGPPDGLGIGGDEPDTAKVRAGDHLKRRWSVRYEYDFGDSWWYTVEMQQVPTLDEKFTRRLVDGARAFPPEDCGGLAGYDDIVAFAAGHEPELHDPDLLAEWGLQHWDPEHFDVAATRRWFDR